MQIKYTIKKLLVPLAVLALLAALATVGYKFAVNRAIDAPKKVSLAVVQDIMDGNFDEAYGQFTTEMKNVRPKDELKAYFAENIPKTDFSIREAFYKFARFQVFPTREATVLINLKSDGESSPYLIIDLERDAISNDWQIDEVTYVSDTVTDDIN